MKTSQLLKKAKALIVDEQRWCREAFARSRNGKAIAVGNVRSYSFCAFGAVSRAYMDFHERYELPIWPYDIYAASPSTLYWLGRHGEAKDINLYEILAALRVLYEEIRLPLSLGTNPLIRFNDTHTHEEVLALFDRAIAAAEGAENEEQTSGTQAPATQFSQDNQGAGS